MTSVMRFVRPINHEALFLVLQGENRDAEGLASGISITALEEAVAGLGADLRKSELDSELIEPLHRALPLSRREASDPRLWQWLCAKAFPGVVWQRWNDGVEPAPDVLSEVLTSAKAGRFLCGPSLHATTRNTLARLWWAAETLDADYELARSAVSDQDLFQSVMDRRYSAYPAAARACFQTLEGRSEEESREALKWLQQVLSTTALECLSSDEVAGILSEKLP